jgi:23S rRNA pseudouridine1911/1915/1917 synthase
LDKDTSGLLVVAKDDWTHAQLAKQFSSRTIEREYWAICWGSFHEPEGEIIQNIARSKKDRKVFTVSNDENEGKFAHTTYQVLEDFGFVSLIKLKLKTGRTHQIRVHLAHLRKPVFGDETYGGRKQLYGLTTPKFKQQVKNLLEMMPRQALHAKTIGFTHPQTGEKVSFDSELPGDMVKLLAELREYFKS